MFALENRRGRSLVLRWRAANLVPRGYLVQGKPRDENGDCTVYTAPDGMLSSGRKFKRGSGNILAAGNVAVRVFCQPAVGAGPGDAADLS